MLSLASSRAQQEQEGNQWMQPHSVSLSCLNVFCAVKNIDKQDVSNRLKHLILLNITLKTKDQEYYIRVNMPKDNYCTHFYVLSVCLGLSFSLIQT